MSLVAAVAAGVAGAAVPVALVSWVLAGPLAIGLLAVFVTRDARAQTRPVYVRPDWIGALYGVTIVIAAAGILLSAWRIADWVGRL